MTRFLIQDRTSRWQASVGRKVPMPGMQGFLTIAGIWRTKRYAVMHSHKDGRKQPQKITGEMENRGAALQCSSRGRSPLKLDA